jgi:diguanylate cyclase (GGDEF)-like protein
VSLNWQNVPVPLLLLLFAFFSAGGSFVEEGWGSPYLFPWLVGLLLLMGWTGYRYLHRGRRYPQHDLEFLSALVLALHFFLQITGGLASPLLPSYYLLTVLVAAFYPIWIGLAVVGGFVALEGAGLAMGQAAGGAAAWPSLLLLAGVSAAIALSLGFIHHREHRMLESLAGRRGVLLHPGELLKNREEGEAPLPEEDRLDRLGDSLLQVDTLLQGILALVAKSIPSHTVALFLKEAGGEALHLRSFVGPDTGVDHEAAIPWGAGLIGWVAREAKPLSVASNPRESQGLGYYREEVPIEAFLAVPVFNARQAVEGVLAIDSLERGAFSTEDQDLLEGFALQIALALQNARISRQIQGIAKHYATLHGVSAALGETLDLRELLERMADLSAQILAYDACLIFLWEAETKQWVLRLARGYDKPPATGLPLQREGTLAGWVVEHHRSLLQHELGKRASPPPLFGHGDLDRPVQSFLGIPLVLGESVMGAVYFLGKQPGLFADHHQHLLGIFCNQAAAALSNALLHQEMANMATQDGLTGLHNHRSFHERLAAECERVHRHPAPLSLLLLDLDHFKQINDTHGHPVGDAVLRRIAVTLRETIRAIDVAARYGGEEFALILPETDETGAEQIGERIRKEIAHSQFLLGETVILVTVSIGIATFPRHGRTKEELLAHADQALYTAKQQGRNRVCLYASPAS